MSQPHPTRAVDAAPFVPGVTPDRRGRETAATTGEGSMNRIRAKFKCVEDTPAPFTTGRKIKLSAVYDPALAEDRSFARATPSATLEMYVDNPDADFAVGVDYYVDFTPVSDEA